jgi:hypothetical protein
MSTNSAITSILVADPQNPLFISNYYGMNQIYYLEYFDNYYNDFFLATENFGGLNILDWDWSAPTSFNLIGYYETPGYAGNADFDGEYIYLMDRYHFEIFQCPDIVSTPYEQSEPKPSSFRLYPPSPNPFNPTTTISFDLPVASMVKLDVFDINGRTVGEQHAAPKWYNSGHHTITFDGSNLSSGIYIYHLTAGDFTASGKMVLLK